jgi:hypothetical protein
MWIGGNLHTSMKCGVLIVCLCLTAVLVPSAARAQLTADSGEITGIVVDEQAAKVPAVKVSLVSAERGLIRVTVSGPDGTYRFPLVAPARYRVEFEADQFEKRVSQEVVVNVGETVRLDATLSLAGLQVNVDVRAAPGTLDPERISQSTIIGSDVLETFPINQRNYLDFAVLTPGVIESTTIVGAADFRVAIAPTSGLSIDGSNGRGNSVLIDGVANNGATGNVRPSVPQEAVQEFQVNRSNYSAEFGGSIGGVLNIVTRPGGNQHRGTAFGFLRNRALDARNYFDPANSAFTRLQTGASAGGPVRRNRSYYFAAIERLDRHETTFVSIPQDPDLLNRPTPSQQGLLRFLGQTGDPALARLSATLGALLTPGNNPLVGPLVVSNTGAFPLNAFSTQASLRFDHRLSDRHQLLVRTNVTDQQDKSSKFGALVGYTHGSSTLWRDWSGIVGDTYILKRGWAGATRLSVAATRFDIQPNDPSF